MSNRPHHGWFEAVADSYQSFRPGYPKTLFRWLADQAPSRQCCWDAACGSGQASVGLAAEFDRVVATDLSPAQIAAAPTHSRIHYRVAPAEHSGLQTSSLDAVVVASAIHWIDVPRFNKEVIRVLKPGGLLAWLGYDPLQGAPEPLQHWLDALYYERLQGLWPAERVHVDHRYADLPFPGSSQKVPDDLRIELNWTAKQLLGFIRTWSALRSNDHQCQDLMATFQQELEALWPPDQKQLPLHLPLMGRWGLLE